jgi:O-antigen/teichoic acid export membrane protein
LKNSLVSSAVSLITSDLGLRFVAEAAARGNSFIVMPLLSWVLGAAVFGSYTQILSLSFAFVPILSLGLGYTVIRQIAANSDRPQSSGILLLSIGLVSGFCLFLAGLLVLFDKIVVGFVVLSHPVEPYQLIMFIIALAWVVATEALTQEYFRAKKWVRYSLFVQLVSISLHLIILSLVVWSGHLSIWSALTVLIFSKLLVVICVLLTILLSETRGGGIVWGRPSGKLLVSGVPFMLAGCAEWAGNLGDRLIVGHYLGAETVAQYTAVVMLLSTIVALGAPLWWLLFPEIVRHQSEGSNERCHAAVISRTMLFIHLGVPALTLICLIADPAVSLLVNTNASGMSLVVLVLGLAILTNQAATGWEYFVVSVSSGKRLMFATVFCGLFGFIVAISLAPHFGIMGVATGVLLGKVTLALTYAVLARHNGFRGLVLHGPKSVVIIVNNMISFAVVVAVLQLSDVTGLVLEIVVAVGAFCVVYALLCATSQRFMRILPESLQ